MHTSCRTSGCQVDHTSCCRWKRLPSPRVERRWTWRTATLVCCQCSCCWSVIVVAAVAAVSVAVDIVAAQCSKTRLSFSAGQGSAQIEGAEEEEEGEQRVKGARRGERGRNRDSVNRRENVRSVDKSQRGQGNRVRPRRRCDLLDSCFRSSAPTSSSSELLLLAAALLSFVTIVLRTLQTPNAGALEGSRSAGGCQASMRTLDNSAGTRGQRRAGCSGAAVATLAFARAPHSSAPSLLSHLSPPLLRCTDVWLRCSLAMTQLTLPRGSHTLASLWKIATFFPSLSTE